ncbi:MAG: septum site-determining protein MinC [Dorea sp.]
MKKIRLQNSADKKLLDESLEAVHERDGQFYKGTLRGRQVLESEQSIVIIGDIEEGATVASKGNVIVTGPSMEP